MTLIDEAKRLHAELKMIVKQAILVLDSLPDREGRWLAKTGSWAAAIDGWEAYGAAAATFRLVPTPSQISQAMRVGDLLLWLGKTEGEKAVKRLASWAHGAPMWRMAGQERCTERTIANRIDRSIAALMTRWNVDAGIEEIEEGKPKVVTSFASEFGESAAGIIDGHSVVWIDGVGPMKNHKRVNNWAPLGEAKRGRI